MSTTRSTRRGARAAAVATLLAAATAVTGCAGSDPVAAPPPSTTTSTSADPSTEPSADPSTEPSSEPPPSEAATPTPTATATATPAAIPAATPAPGATAAPSSPATSGAAQPAQPATLRRGDAGPAVREVQERLASLGYWLGAPDGEYGLLTSQAVLALQGAAGLGRDGVLGPRTREALEAGVVPRASTSSGRVTEVDRDAGLVLFVEDGRVERALHTSTGTYEEYQHDGETLLADTPAGTFEVSWAVDGWRDGALGRLYRPRYFHPDGIAVHGYTSVPAQPASHGCARVTTEAMDMVWREDLMPIGSTVVVR